MSGNWQAFPNTTDQREATPRHRGLMSKEDKAKLDATTASFTTADETKLDALGSVLSASSSANTGRAATTDIDLLTKDLTVGVWYVTGKCNVLFGATPGQVDLRLVGLSIGASTLSLAAGAEGTIHAPPAVVTVASGTTTVTLRGYGSQAWTSQGTGGAGGNGNLITIHAVRVG